MIALKANKATPTKATPQLHERNQEGNISNIKQIRV